MCTYKRPLFLRRLLEGVERQVTNGLFTFSVIVVDNDRLESAKQVISEFAVASTVTVTYCIEPQQNIALARNKAIDNATGDYIAFIDDDEFPENTWLRTLFEACNKYGVDGVLGPVKPHFDEKPPKWIVKGKFYERPTYETGFKIDWTNGRTGNVLLKRQIFNLVHPAFNPEFLTGEDQDFFRRMIHEKGHVFIWCNEAIAYEIVPPIRWKRRFILRRALLRGKVSIKHPTFGVLNTTKSMVAVLAYSLLLPVFLLLGQHVLMQYLDKIFWHIGKLVAVLGLDPIKDKYVTE